jgi:Predicted hydrolases or acyltransferases (alpha/beta hydrolase superfamily)
MLSEVDFGAGAVPWYQHPTGKTDAPIVHFSAANGFPVASYQEFYNAFEEKLSFTAMDSRGTWPSKQPPPRNFSTKDFVADLIRGIESQYSEPVIGMGHSHGGLLTTIAALQRPDLFSKLVLIEPATSPDNIVGHSYRYIPRWLLIKLVPFIRGSHERRRLWPSRQAFYDRYHGHPTFKHFSDTALHDYAKHGLRKRADGQFELVYLPEWESHVFCRVLPIWPYLRKMPLPTLLIRAEHSFMYSATQFASYSNNLSSHVTSTTVENTHHLVTHEDPSRIAKVITDWLN